MGQLGNSKQESKDDELKFKVVDIDLRDLNNSPIVSDRYKRHKPPVRKEHLENRQTVSPVELDHLDSASVKTVLEKLSIRNAMTYIRRTRKHLTKASLMKGVFRWSLPVLVSLITVIVLGSNAKAATPPTQADLQTYLASNQLSVYEQIASNNYPEIFYPLDGQNVQLTSDNYVHLHPESSNQYVTWQGTVNGQTEIFLDDLYNGAITQLSYGDTNGSQSMDNGSVVWQQSNGSDSQIMYYDGFIVRQITDDSDSSIDPSIDSSQIIYAEDLGNGNWESNSYDISSGQTTVLSQGDAASSGNPHFNSDGSVSTSFPTQ